MFKEKRAQKCLEKNNMEYIRKDLDNRPIENIDGKSSPEDILKILSKYGIEISHRLTPNGTEKNKK